MQEKFLGIMLCIMYAYLQVSFQKQVIKKLYHRHTIKKFNIFNYMVCSSALYSVIHM